MNKTLDFTKLRTSWTKYDIVQVMEVIDSLRTIEDFKSKKAIINEPILRSFLGIKSLEDPIPQYWIEIQNFPNEKKLFALFATLFTHGEIIKEFASKYSTGNMKGVFKIESGKQYTNIRSALIESGASKSSYRRTEEVPFDFTPIFQNPAVGKLFKQVLLERFSRFGVTNLSNDEFYKISFENDFHSALSLQKEQFESWLEGYADFENNFIEEFKALNFFSIEDAALKFYGSKEVYFLGENGDGKSLFLMGLYLAFNGNFVLESTDQQKTGKASDIFRNNRHASLTGIDDRGTEYNPQRGIFIENFFAYGTHRGRYSTDRSEEYGFMSLFDSEQTLTNPITWLKDQKLLELEKALDKDNMIGEHKELPNSYPVKLLEDIFYDLLERNVEIKIEGTGVNFTEKGMTLSFDQLSEGYKSILIFVSDLLYRLSKNSKGDEKITNLKGIVLVDEIDLHLHPKWQRLIVNKLRTIFPNIQFVFTTHSPMIIQGASPDAIIFRVYRNKEDGITRVSEPYFRKKLDHLMINTVLTSPLFGMIDSRMDSKDDFSDTSETYLLYKIDKKIKLELEKQKAKGKEFVSDAEIDRMIDDILKEELGND
jgi:predicted ATPase